MTLVLWAIRGRSIMNDSIALTSLLFLVFLATALFVGLLVNSGGQVWKGFEASFVTRTTDNLQRLFLFTDARRILRLYVVLFAVGPLLVLYFLDSVVLCCLLLLTLAFLPGYSIKRLQRRRSRLIADVLPDVLDQISGSMLAGSTFVGSVQSMVDENSGPVKQEFSLMLREIRMGASLDDALDNLAERVRSEDMDMFVSAAMIARDVGGNLAETLSRLSDSLRRRNEMEKKIRALTAQGVLQGWVVSLLPLGILTILTFIEPEAVDAMFNSVLGWIFLLIVVVLEVLGGFFISRIVRIDI